MSRNTVARYRVWAGRHGVLDGGPLPDPATLADLLAPAPTERPAHEQSLVEPWRERVLALHERGVEGQAIWQLLVEEHGFLGSYSSVKRFLRRLAPARSRATLRLEVAPGEETQVDFGYAGQFLDPESGRVRRAWVFVMTLSFSRHQYAELVFEQTIETWLRLHRTAFEFFGGVPRRIVLDNLRAAIVHAALYDPEVQRSYRDCAEHYGFLIAPCRPSAVANPPPGPAWADVSSGIPSSRLRAARYQVRRPVLTAPRFPSGPGMSFPACREVLETALAANGTGRAAVSAPQRKSLRTGEW
jgi:hypothetical protein